MASFLATLAKQLEITCRVSVIYLFRKNVRHSSVNTPDDINNEYATNIQIADLNSLNAVLAVIKWKKMSGFYQDLKQEHNTTYSINVSQLTNNDTNT